LFQIIVHVTPSMAMNEAPKLDTVLQAAGENHIPGRPGSLPHNRGFFSASFPFFG